jgi:hypothetical protein
MSFSIAYNILFEVKILHHFFLNRGDKAYDTMNDEEKADIMLKYDVRDFFDIKPTEDCKRILRSHNCLCKMTSNGIIAGLRAEPDGSQPPKFSSFMPLADDLKLTFLVSLRDMDFMNYTALPLKGNENRVYSFQNTTTGNPKKFPALSTIPPIYKAATEYMPGDMLSDNALNQTKLFTAKLKTSNATSNATDWLKEQTADNVTLQYVNSNDRYPIVRGTYLYKVTSAGVEPAVTVKTANGITITPEVMVLPGEFRSLQVDMRLFPDGFYMAHVESADHLYQDDVAFYLLQQRETPFGIIQLTVKSDDAAFNMVDAQGFLRSPVYELHFRNRFTHWRYAGKKFNADSVTDGPLPLTRFGFIENVKVKGKDGSFIDDLPNPSVSIIKTEALTSPAERKFYSEIHIN